MKTWAWRLVALVVLGIQLTLAGCGGGSSGGGTPAPQAPAIGTAPASITVAEGATATFSVAATGSAPLAYQWQRDGVDIAGANAATYAITSVTLADSGAQIQVVVSNSAGSVTSTAATLTVTPAPNLPLIVSQPVGITVAPGTAASFRVQADGTPPLAYQWQRDGVDIPGATEASYTLPAPTAADNDALFQVVVSNAAGSVASATALLSVDANVVAPTIVTQPQSVAVVDGSSAILTVVASGTEPFSYQWRRNGADIFGGTANSLATPVLTPADSGAVYSVVVSNGAGSITSAEATVTVNYQPITWVAQPAATSVAVGQTAAFTAIASGSQTITYQWQRNGVDIAGATAASYTTPATTAGDDGTQYVVVATNPAGSLASTAARLTVVAAPVAPAIATAPASLTVSVGQLANFTVTAAGTGPLAYQWLRNGAAIAGATAASYTTAAATPADDAARFSVRVTNAAGSVTSAEAVLTVQAGRLWEQAQRLETDDNPVQDRVSGIDDAGRVTVVFRKSNGARDVIYATRGTPGTAGAVSTWSAPVAIDLLAGLPVSNMSPGQVNYDVVIAPGGNALAHWYHRAPCTASTYNITGTCRYRYMARYSAADDAWSAPELIGDTPGLDFKAVINDRGDMALFGTSWVRLGTNRYTEAPALFARDTSQATLTRQLVNAVPLGAWAFDMDAAGNLLLAAEAQQNATTDLVAWRGTAAGGLSAQQVLDTRGDAATLLTARLGRNGQQVVVWRQSNGTATAVWSASSSSATGSWATAELGALRVFGDTILTVSDSGDALLVNRYYGWRWGWSGGTWTALSDLPADNPTSVFLTCAHARNGNYLCIASSGSGEGNTGRWATYDASRNVMVQALQASRPASGYILGVNTINRGVGYERPLLSENGIGATTMLNRYDVLPTAAAPAGDSRTIDNLWGVYLK